MGASRAVLIPRIKPRRCTGGTDVASSSRENEDPVTPSASGGRVSKVHHATPALEPRRKPSRQPLANRNVNTAPKPCGVDKGAAQKAADALRRHADDARTEGTKAVRQAVEDDHAGKLESAVGLYAKALRYFEVYLRLERNKEQTDAVRPKVDQYRARLAKLREVLRAHHAARAKTRRSPPRDAADETASKDESSDKPDETLTEQAPPKEAPPKTELKVILPRGDSTFVLAPLRSVAAAERGETKDDADEWSLEDEDVDTDVEGTTAGGDGQVDVEKEWEEFERKVRDSPEVELEAAVLEGRKKSPAKEANVEPVFAEPAPVDPVKTSAGLVDVLSRSLKSAEVHLEAVKRERETTPELEPKVTEPKEPEPKVTEPKVTEPDADSLAADSDSDTSYVWDGLSGGEYGMWSDNDDDVASDAESDVSSESFDIDGAVNAWTSWGLSKLDTHLKNLNTKYQASWAPAVDRLKDQAKKKFEQEWSAQFPSDEEYKKELGSKEYPSELNYALPEVPLAERVSEDPAVAKKVT